MTQPELIVLAKASAESHGLAPELVCAVIEQESDWDTYAFRYESGFFAKYVAPFFTSGKITDFTELESRGFSWGLMQVMGQTAREYGYSGYLTKLCDPATGVDVGCTVLAAKLKSKDGDIHAALLAWNGGGNIGYPQQVLDRCSKYRAQEQTT